MYNDDTIVAIATASGIGSISIVRVSGAKALEIALKISQKTTINPRIATLSYLYDKEQNIIDDFCGKDKYYEIMTHKEEYLLNENNILKIEQ